MIVGYAALVSSGMADSPKRRLVIDRDSKYREWSVEKNGNGIATNGATGRHIAPGNRRTHAGRMRQDPWLIRKHW